MWVVLQSKVCLRESYWDMRPRCPETSAFIDVGDCFEIFFPLLLCLMDWFVGSSGDGIDDVDPAGRGCVDCSLGDLPRL